MATLKMGDGFDPDVNQGPLINEEAILKVIASTISHHGDQLTHRYDIKDHEDQCLSGVQR